MNIVFVADIFVKDYPIGGGEKSNDEFIYLTTKMGHNIISKNSYLLSLKEIEQYNKQNYSFIIANFICLQHKIKEYITNNCKYLIIEHDHKYLKNRNPREYNNFKAPPGEIINYDFYKNAKVVVCQSNLHKDILLSNLKINNVISLGGNFWSDDELNYIKSIKKQEKNDVASVLNFSSNPSKGTDLAINYCVKNKIKYKLIEPTSTKEFLSQISHNKYLVFIPRTPETLSRIVIEAKMLDVQVKTIKKLIGACNEKWWEEYNSEQLLNYMMNEKNNFCKSIIQYLEK